MYACASRVPMELDGSSWPMRGSATVTIVESRNTMPDATMTASRIQRDGADTNALEGGVAPGEGAVVIRVMVREWRTTGKDVARRALRPEPSPPGNGRPWH